MRYLCFAVITLEFEQVVCTVSEAGGTAEVVITKNGLSSGPIRVLLSTVNGNASGIVSLPYYFPEFEFYSNFSDRQTINIIA